MLPLKRPFRREGIMTKLKINSQSWATGQWKGTRVATDEKYESAEEI